MSLASNDRIVEAIQPTHLSLDAAMFAENFDKRGFHLEHQLVGHPLLELPAIAALSERLPANLLEWNTEQDGAFTEPNKLHPHHLIMCGYDLESGAAACAGVAAVDRE
jgi:hypothetical protein